MVEVLISPERKAVLSEGDSEPVATEWVLHSDGEDVKVGDGAIFVPLVVVRKGIRRRKSRWHMLFSTHK